MVLHDFFIELWLIQLANVKGHPLSGDYCFFLTLTKAGKLKTRKKMAQNLFMDLLC